jgi:hypothetical protein
MTKPSVDPRRRNRRPQVPPPHARLLHSSLLPTCAAREAALTGGRDRSFLPISRNSKASSLEACSAMAENRMLIRTNPRQRSEVAIDDDRSKAKGENSLCQKASNSTFIDILIYGMSLGTSPPGTTMLVAIHFAKRTFSKPFQLLPAPIKTSQLKDFPAGCPRSAIMATPLPAICLFGAPFYGRGHTHPFGHW